MRPTVLAYHAIGTCPRTQDPANLFVDPDTFARQVDYLVRHRTIVSLDEAMSPTRSFAKPAVAITFDDAYRVLLEHALPVLEEHSLPATVFAPVAHLGERNSWDPPSECAFDIMSAQEIRDWEARGMTVETHGYHHVDHTTLTQEESSEEIVTSMDELESLLGRRPRYFAYPYGLAPARSRSWLDSLGLAAAFTIDRRSTDPWSYERVQVTPLDGDRLFAFKTRGFYLAARWSLPLRLGYAAVRPLVRYSARRSHTA